MARVCAEIACKYQQMRKSHATISSMQDAKAQMERSPDGLSVKVSGDWAMANLASIEASLNAFIKASPQACQIQAGYISDLDSAGAWLLLQLQQGLQTKNRTVRLVGLSEEQKHLMALVSKEQAQLNSKPRREARKNMFYALGRRAVDKWCLLLSFLAFFGELAVVTLRCLFNPIRIQWRSVMVTIDQMGFRALPIIALMSFLIGVVLAYQMGLQLEQYDANIYIVDLTGMAIFREFGPLITAIIVAGRTATAFTSQIGTMKVSEEIDALTTMGIAPMERLVLPKVIGMVIALPLLTVWADIFGVLGSMVMSHSMLGINCHDFLARFHMAVNVSEYFVGVVKSPIFALVIAAVGCYQGFQVTRGADSVGQMTTRAAVQALFLIIIIDALFSVFFSMVGI